MDFRAGTFHSQQSSFDVPYRWRHTPLPAWLRSETATQRRGCLFTAHAIYWLRVPACVSTSPGPFPNSLGQIVPFSRPKITRKARLANHFGYWRRAQGGSLDPSGHKLRSTMFPQTRRHRILLLLIVETPRAKQTRYCERYVKLHLILVRQ